MPDARGFRITPALGGVVIALLAVTSAALGDASGIGVIAEYRPASGRYSLQRGSTRASIPVRIGTVVQEGDRVTLPDGASVVLRLANGERTELKGPGEFPVPKAPPLGRLATIFGSIPSLFDDEFRLEGTAASRGGQPCTSDGTEPAAIDVPILVPGAKVVGGVRDLPLAWTGGCAPFVVALLSGERKLLDRESIAGRQVRLDDVELVPGRYEISIVDARGTEHRAGLEAVSSGPDLPAELAADTSSLGLIAQAVWLSQQDGGRWRVDSFERLRPLIRSGDSLAGAIGDGVLWGASSDAAGR